MSTPKVYRTLEELYSTGINEKDFIVADERNFGKKKCFTFSKYYNFLSFFGKYYDKVLEQRSLPIFSKHEVIGRFKQWRKVVFDIDAEGVSEEKYQQIIDSLVSALQDKDVIGLDIEKELVVCTSHGPGKFSAHLVLLCFVHRDKQDLEHLYKLVEERMPPCLYKYVDKSLASFNHNLRLLGSTKQGRTKVYNPVWTFKGKTIVTQLPENYPDFDEPNRKFINWFTTYEDTPCISPIRIFFATTMSMVDGCRHLHFNLPDKPKARFEMAKNIDKDRIWEALLKECRGYDEQFELLDIDKESLLKLRRIKSGYCYICKRVHDSSDGFISVVGKEESLILGCFRSKKGKYITCFKPELRKPYEEGSTELREGEVIEGKKYTEELCDKATVQCVSAPMGMGKTFALKKFLQKLPSRTKICILSSRISFSDSTQEGLNKLELGFKHYKQENQHNLYRCGRLIIQMESLYKISGENSMFDLKGKYDYVILDEFSSLCRQFFSTTMDAHRYINSIVFENLIRETGKVIVMDAFLKQDHIDLLRYFRPTDDLKITRYIHPNPVIRQCIKFVKNKEEEKENSVEDRQAIINKISSMAQEGLKIYVPSYSKEFVKDLCSAFKENGMGDKIQDYTADTSENIKRADMRDVNTSWKKVQVVAATGTVGAGIDFSEQYFDVTFAIIGRSSKVEEQFQLIHRVRNTNQNLLYLWMDRPGKGKKGVPTKRQIRKELDRKHRSGIKMSPELVSMTSWLKKIYVVELQEMYKTKRQLEKEVTRLLKEQHYVTTEVPIGDKSGMQRYKHKVPKYRSIKTLTPEEHDEVNLRVKSGNASAEDKLAIRKRNLSKYVNVDEVPSEVIEPLWEMCERNPKVKTYLFNASLELGKATSQDVQLNDYKKSVFSELSNENRPRYEVITALNNVLGLEFSFDGNNNTKIEREDFAARVRPILENEEVQKLYGFKASENEKEYVKMVNTIYKDWTGKTKVVCHKDRVRRNRVHVTPYILEETTIGENIPIRKYICPNRSTAYMRSKELEDSNIINKEYELNRNIRMGKEIDEKNKLLHELRSKMHEP